MRTLLTLLLALSMVAWLGACGDKHADDHGDDHGDEKGHVDGKGDDKDPHGHGGDKHPLGEKTLGAWKVQVHQVGEIEPDAKQAIFEIEITGAAVSAVRAQITTPDGKTSLKGKANDLGKGVFDVHVTELPKPLPEGSKVTVEIAGADDTKATGDFEVEIHEE